MHDRGRAALCAQGHGQGVGEVAGLLIGLQHRDFGHVAQGLGAPGGQVGEGVDLDLGQVLRRGHHGRQRGGERVRRAKAGVAASTRNVADVLAAAGRYGRDQEGAGDIRGDIVEPVITRLVTECDVDRSGAGRHGAQLDARMAHWSHDDAARGLDGIGLPRHRLAWHRLARRACGQGCDQADGCDRLPGHAPSGAERFLAARGLQEFPRNSST